MTRSRWSSVLGALLLVGMVPLGGCVLRVQARPAYVVESEPPPPRYEPRPGARAGYVWVAGRWEWRGNAWAWSAGRWQPARVDYVWVDGHWDRRGHRYHWIEGHWERSGRGTVVVHPREDRGRVVVPAQPGPAPAEPAGHPAHEHAHAHPHAPGDHHHHPHAHPHRAGADHHHPY